MFGLITMITSFIKVCVKQAVAQKIEGVEMLCPGQIKSKLYHTVSFFGGEITNNLFMFNKFESK